MVTYKNNDLHRIPGEPGSIFRPRRPARGPGRPVDNGPSGAMLPLPVAALHHPVKRPSLPGAVAALSLLAGAVQAAEPACVPGGDGRLDLVVSGSLEARAAWSGEHLECQGMPRPDGRGMRLMFANREASLLVVLGVSGIGRGETGRGLPGNFTLVREGAGEFYSTLGDEVCRIDILEAREIPGSPAGRFVVAGEGECPGPVPAVAREGSVTVRPFAFKGIVLWPADAGAER